MIKISRRNGWSAELTTAGRYYIEHGHHPDHPDHADVPATARRLTRLQRPVTAQPALESSRATSPTSTVGSVRRRQPTNEAITNRRRAAAEQLIADLVENGRVEVVQPTDEELAELRKVVDFAKRHRLVPEGKRIEKTRRWGGRQLEIELLTGSHPNSRGEAFTDLPLVPIPDQLRRLHPVLAGLRDDKGRMVMPDQLRRRALLLLHALATEAVKRDYEIQESPVDRRHHYQDDRYYPRPAGRPKYFRREGELKIVIDGFSYVVSIRQEAPESAKVERCTALQLEVPYSATGRWRWADRKRTKLEDTLPTVLHELEQKAVADRRAQTAEERAKAERRTQWEAAMVEARRQAVEAHYAAVLAEELEGWTKAATLRRYSEALAERITAAADDQNLTYDELMVAKEWLSWIRDYAERRDPLRGLPVMPPEPTIQDHDLGPFLAGWSPSGPEVDRNGRWRP